MTDTTNTPQMAAPHATPQRQVAEAVIDLAVAAVFSLVAALCVWAALSSPILHTTGRTIGWVLAAAAIAGALWMLRQMARHLRLHACSGIVARKWQTRGSGPISAGYLRVPAPGVEPTPMVEIVDPDRPDLLPGCFALSTKRWRTLSEGGLFTMRDGDQLAG